MHVKVYGINPGSRLWLNQYHTAHTKRLRRYFFTDYAIVFYLAKDKFILINTLSGAVDYIEGIDVSGFGDMLNAEKIGKDALRLRKHLFRRGYLFCRTSDEQRAMKNVCSWFARAHKGYKFLLMLTTRCNFACTYCYERGLVREQLMLSGSQLEAALTFIGNYVRKNKARNEGVSIQLFGGEPLLVENMPRVKRVLEHATKRGWKVGATTNGYTLMEYAPLLGKHKQTLGSILVTLDGSEKIHNKRRRLLRGRRKGTFRTITRGLEELARRRVRFTINVVLDKYNVSCLPGLQRYFKCKGWDVNPRIGFLFTKRTSFLKDRCPTLEDEHSYRLCARVRKGLGNVHFETLPKFVTYVGSVLFPEDDRANRKNLLPSLDGCSQKAFAVHGDSMVYRCSVMSSAQDLPLWIYSPRIRPLYKNIRLIQNANIRGIKECRECKVALLCGGPCPARYLSKKNGQKSLPCPGQEGAVSIILNYLASNRARILKRVRSLKTADVVIESGQ